MRNIIPFDEKCYWERDQVRQVERKPIQLLRTEWYGVWQRLSRRRRRFGSRLLTPAAVVCGV